MQNKLVDFLLFHFLFSKFLQIGKKMVFLQEQTANPYANDKEMVKYGKISHFPSYSSEKPIS